MLKLLNHILICIHSFSFIQAVAVADLKNIVDIVDKNNHKIVHDSDIIWLDTVSGGEQNKTSSNPRAGPTCYYSLHSEVN